MRRHAKAIVAISALLLTMTLGVSLASAAPPPALTIDPVTTHSITTAHVSGTVDPEAAGASIPYYFEYSRDPGSEGWANFVFAGEISEAEAQGTDPIPVDGGLSGLSASTEYQVRLTVVSGGEFSSPEPNASFTTDPVPNAPALALDPPASVSYTSAHLSGSVNPEGGNEDAVAGPVPIDWELQANREGEGWETKGSGTVEGAEAASTAAIPAQADLTELKPGAEYAFRLRAAYAGIEALSSEGHFTTDPVAPPSVTLDPVTTFTGTTAHFSGAIDPEAPGGNPAAFSVTYRFQCTPDCPALKGDREIEADSDSHLVSEDATGLDPNTSYEVKLVAENKGGVEAATQSFKTTAVGPEVISLPVGPVTETTAVIGGWVNPHNTATAYYAEYSSDPGFPPSGSNSVPASKDENAGSANQQVPVSYRITGLSPDTEYFFRVVAHSAAGDEASDPQGFRTLAPLPPEGPCPNEEFRTGPSAALPECRAFEKVTPDDKNGGDALGAAALDNNHVGFSATAPFLPEDRTFSVRAPYLASRGEQGWRSQPAALGRNTGFADFDASFSRQIVEGRVSLTADDLDGSASDVWIQSAEGLQRISKGPLGGNAAIDAHYVGQSSNGSRIFLATAEHLIAADADRTAGEQLYEYRVGGLRLVALDASGDPLGTEGTSAAGDTIKGCGSLLETGNNPISNSGSIVYFYTPDLCVDPEAPLYAQIDGEEPKEVSASQCSRSAPDPPCVDTGQMLFSGAANDGTIVYFATAAQLLDEDTDELVDLYSYDLNAKQLTRITSFDQNLTCITGKCGYVGTVEVSKDGTRIAFVAAGMTDGVGSDERGLFVHDMATDNTAFVPVPGSIYNDSAGIYSSPREADGDESLDYLVFRSTVRLTAYDNDGEPEVYRYRLATGEIACVSCSPTGALLTGQSKILQSRILEGRQMGLGLALAPWMARWAPPAIGEDGTIVFVTPEALSSRDTNNSQDVYMWKEGRSFLLTEGTGAGSVSVGGVSPDGHDIFLATADRLLPRDVDLNFDVYDARIDGGLRVDQRSPDQKCLSTEECREGVSAAAPGGSASTNGFVGPSNRTDLKRRCRKGRIHRKGVCVARHHRQGGKRRRSGQVKQMGPAPRVETRRSR